VGGFQQVDGKGSVAWEIRSRHGIHSRLRKYIKRVEPQDDLLGGAGARERKKTRETRLGRRGIVSGFLILLSASAEIVSKISW